MYHTYELVLEIYLSSSIPLHSSTNRSISYSSHREHTQNRTISGFNTFLEFLTSKNTQGFPQVLRLSIV